MQPEPLARGCSATITDPRRSMPRPSRLHQAPAGLALLADGRGSSGGLHLLGHGIQLQEGGARQRGLGSKQLD